MKPQRTSRRQSRQGGAAGGLVVPGGRRGRLLAAGVLLAAATVVAYLPATAGGFVWDDGDYVAENEALRSAAGLWRIWFDLEATPQYYPLVYTTYWLEYRAWGLDPRGYHVVNVLLHAGVALLLWHVLVRLGVPGAWLAAAVFALHPVHVESVAWITQRKNVLSGVFYLAAMAAYLRFAFPATEQADRGRRGIWYAAAIVLFLAALLSKTVTCTLPAVLVLVLWWRRGSLRRADLLALLPLFVLGMVLGLLTSWVETRYAGALGPDWSLTLVERCLVAGRALWFYAGKLVWPSPLAFIYPRWEIDAGRWWQYVYPLAAVGVLAALWLLRGRLGRGPLVAVLCFAGTLFPALGFFNVYYMRYSYVADHWQYLASIGVIVLVVSAGRQCAQWGGSWGKRAGVVAAAVLLGVLGTLTWRQGYIYADLEGLWRDTLAKSPRAWIAHHNLGVLLRNTGRLEEAERHLRRTLEIRPTLAKGHSNLAAVLKQQGRLEEAVAAYERALEVEPGYAVAHYNLGILFKDQGRLAEAEKQYRAALRSQPKHAEARVNLGWVLMQQGQLAEAAEEYRAALQIQPDLPQAHLNLGVVTHRTGDLAAAVEHFRRAAAARPDFVQARYYLATALLQQGALEEALAEYEAVLRLDPAHAEARRGRAEAMQRRDGRP